jgi:hypothetical protein
MLMCRLRHINDPVLSSLKMEVYLYFFGPFRSYWRNFVFPDDVSVTMKYYPDCTVYTFREMFCARCVLPLTLHYKGDRERASL